MLIRDFIWNGKVYPFVWGSETHRCKFDLLKDCAPVGARIFIKTTSKAKVYKEIQKLVQLEDAGAMRVIDLIKNEDWYSKYTDSKLTSGEYTKLAEAQQSALRQQSSALQRLGDAIEELKKPTSLEQSMIEAIIEKGKDLAVDDLKDELINRLDTFIKDTYGVLPTKIQLVDDEKVVGETTGTPHKMFKPVTQLVNSNIPVMLVGGAGTGKNYMLQQIAGVMGLEFYYTGAVTQEYKITGFIDARGTYHETEFYKAFTKGGVFMLDEVDASSSEVLLLLNGAIANHYFDFPTGRETAHENFRVVCAGNTYGNGADMVYVGRNVLDGATLDRFVVVEMDYDDRVEQVLCPDKNIYEFVLECRKAVNETKIRHIVGMRASINAYKCSVLGWDKGMILRSVIFKGLGVDDLNILKNKLNNRITSDWLSALVNLVNEKEALC